MPETELRDGKGLDQCGRVLAVTALWFQLKEATKRSYKNIEKITFRKIIIVKTLGFDL